MYDMYDSAIQTTLAQVASLIRKNPGLEGPIHGGGRLASALASLLEPWLMRTALLELLRAWRNADGVGMNVEPDGNDWLRPGDNNETVFRLRIGERRYIVDAREVPTIFALMLSVLPSRRENGKLEYGQRTPESDQIWHEVTKNLGFYSCFIACYVDGNGTRRAASRLDVRGNGASASVPINPATILHLAKAKTGDEFTTAAFYDTLCHG